MSHLFRINTVCLRSLTSQYDAVWMKHYSKFMQMLLLSSVFFFGAKGEKVNVQNTGPSRTLQPNTVSNNVYDYHGT